MSGLTTAQMTVIANTEPIRTQLAKLLVDIAPLLWRLSLIKQRNRSRQVTRRKQRNHW